MDLSRLDARTRAAVDGQFSDKFHRDLAAAVERQTQTAKRNANGQRWRSELAPQYEIDPVVDSLWRQCYGHNYTENRDLMRFLARRNPEIVVPARSGKVQVGYGKRPKDPRTQGPKTGCRFMPGTLRLAA